MLLSPPPLSVNLPTRFYDQINISGQIPPKCREILDSFLAVHNFSRLILFGAGRTGQAVRNSVGNRFSAFVDTASLGATYPKDGDAVLITTAPLHTPQVKEALAHSPLAGLPVITLFRQEGPTMRLILETQPRSGTDYTINNLRKALNLDYASVYNNGQRGHLSDDGLLFCEPAKGNGYIVKSHFTNPLHYPEYRYCPTLFLFGFFPDTYYKWARMLAPAEDRPTFRLTRNRPEWHVVQGYIPLHLKWLDYIADKTWIRFEDFYLDFAGVLATMARILKEPIKGFSPPGDPSRRLYWTEDFARCFDQEVKAMLLEQFAEPIRKFYPEKSSLLS